AGRRAPGGGSLVGGRERARHEPRLVRRRERGAGGAEGRARPLERERAEGLLPEVAVGARRSTRDRPRARKVFRGGLQRGAILRLHAPRSSACLKGKRAVSGPFGRPGNGL